MNLKKVIAAGTTAILLCAPVLSVSAAEMTPDAFAKALRESGKEELIIDVEAYKAAYSDLEAAFGDDTEAYVQHYLTVGILEGRTKGVLFDPLTYAEAYGDIKAAYGNDILAIVNHYINFGVIENRTIGTANGYADIAEAAIQTGVMPVSALLAAGNAALPVADAGTSPAALLTTGTDNAAPAGIITTPGYGAATGNTDVTVGTADNGSSDVAAGNEAVSPDTAGTTAAGNNQAAAPANPGAVTAPAPANPLPGNPSEDNASNNQNYSHTTSVYDSDGSTLIRVEYYDANDKLIEYSQVTNYDSNTNSYTETIYGVDDIDNPKRTDTYVDGVLSSSDTP